MDESGEVVGTHDGSFAYTVGQRRGLHLGRPAADGKPRFVLDIEPVSGTVTRGAARGADRRQTDRERGPLVRSHPHRAVGVHGAAACPRGRAPRRRHPSDGDVVVELLDPAQGIAPGQSAVVYDGTRVVGSCTITATSRTLATR